MNLVNKLNQLNTLYSDGMEELRVLNHIRFKNSDCSLSVQASQFHYCSPRKTVALENYTHFEVMANLLPQDIPKEWIDKYYDGSEIFAFVPKEDIESLLDVLDEKYKIV